MGEEEESSRVWRVVKREKRWKVRESEKEREIKRKMVRKGEMWREGGRERGRWREGGEEIGRWREREVEREGKRDMGEVEIEVEREVENKKRHITLCVSKDNEIKVNGGGVSLLGDLVSVRIWRGGALV